MRPLSSWRRWIQNMEMREEVFAEFGDEKGLALMINPPRAQSETWAIRRNRTFQVACRFPLPSRHVSRGHNSMGGADDAPPTTLE